MVEKATGNSGRFLNGEWHETRHDANTKSFSIDDWGDIDITKYDLEDIPFDRKRKESTYITEANVVAEGGAKPGEDTRDDPVRD